MAALGAATSEARPAAAVRAFNEGVRFFNAKDFNQAIPYFDEAISADPAFADAFYARGSCKYYLQSPEAALADLNAALRARPEIVGARSLRGVIYYESDRWDAAMEDFNEVLARDAAEPQALLGRGVIRLKRDELAGAERDLRAFLRVLPGDPMAPRIRQVLASMAPQSPALSGQTAVPSPRSLTREDRARLADLLKSNPIADEYQRKVLRGENAQAVGDIRSVPSVPLPKRSIDAEGAAADRR